MNWKKILKRDDESKKRLLKDLFDELNDLSDVIDDEGGKLSELDNDLYQEIKPLLTDEKVNQYEGDLKQAEKLWDEVYNYKHQYSNALADLANFFEEVLHDLEEEKEDGDGTLWANTPSGGEGIVHPSYKGYKLKDDEQWGESIMEDGKAYLVPKPIDNMYGAEW